MPHTFIRKFSRFIDQKVKEDPQIICIVQTGQRGGSIFDSNEELDAERRQLFEDLSQFDDSFIGSFLKVVGHGRPL